MLTTNLAFNLCLSAPAARLLIFLQGLRPRNPACLPAAYLIPYIILYPKTLHPNPIKLKPNSIQTPKPKTQKT